ncbi:unnamed protein product [Fraxinus pennsylvanica]|uniref:Carboxypeptidase n=1 Tax=Fraxinus pennsylvanica TaxID=56036 RepID=A0AAD2DW29_9LAMI|nr:unnamed protein product [Fraxinus pennsylvanica]
MKSKTTQILVLFHLFLTCFINQSSGKKQNEALSHLYNEKFRKNTAAIDRSQFSASSYINGAEIHPQKGTKKKDRIRRLPGQPQVGFRQYGGYITVNKTAGRAFYYYLAEADEHSRKSLPLLVWLNGGPGCSSLGYGAMQEIGPFRVHSDGKTLYKNKLAWNHAANVLFLESPAGVGFSYSNMTTDFVKGGDRRTAIDNYIFLLNWLERFSEYKDRDFYISGESYAGHYVPQLALTILHHNKKANKTIINLKGIVIGNAVIDDETDRKGVYDYLATHALISDETLYQIQKFCNFSSNVSNQSDECNEACDEADTDVYSLDVYNIYAPLCTNSRFSSYPKGTSVMNFDPCSDDYVHIYLNRPDVQEALHANVTKIHYNWQSCSDVIQKWEDSPSTVIPLLKELMANGLRVWIFSGDTDGVIPITSTKYSINHMKLSVKTSWRPWFLGREVGGYTKVYEGNLTFATVRGAGHQVPSYQPARALSLVKHFLDGKQLPTSSKH